MSAARHSKEQHHQTAGRKPAAEEWKQPDSAKDTTTFRGTQILNDILLNSDGSMTDESMD